MGWWQQSDGMEKRRWSMGMQGTKALRSERRWQDQMWTVLSPWDMGSATADLKMGKGQYTVDGAAKAHGRVKVEHPFGVLKQQFGLRKTRRRGPARNHSKVTALAPLTNFFLAREK